MIVTRFLDIIYPTALNQKLPTILPVTQYSQMSILSRVLLCHDAKVIFLKNEVKNIKSMMLGRMALRKAETSSG